MNPDEVIAADPRLQPRPVKAGGYAPVCVVDATAFSRSDAETVLRAAGYAAAFRSATADAPAARDYAGRMLAGHWLAGSQWVALYLEMLPPLWQPAPLNPQTRTI